MSSTKIICTIGPKSASVDMLQKYAASGMSVARLNGSHNILEWHKETISLIKNTLPNIPILLDIPGKKIRTSYLSIEPTFIANDKIIITTDINYKGKEKVIVDYKDLHTYLKSGDKIYADDGQLSFIVESIQNGDIVCKALVAGILKVRKGINIPGVTLASEIITTKDQKMLKFACDNMVEYVGISFVESKMHVEVIKEVLKSNSLPHITPPKIVAKVENQRGLKNLEEILEVTDVVMIDRGDLAVETELEHVVLHQKMIINNARKHGVPIIVATEMLHTMVTQPNPTKAEVADITNAILDGASAIMLSGETAVGDYGIDAIKLMKKLAEIVPFFNNNQTIKTSRDCEVQYYNYVIKAAHELCNTLPITKILTITKTGFAAKMMSSSRPAQEILCITNDMQVAKSSNLFYGTRGVLVDISFEQDNTSHVEKSICWLIDNAYINEDDFILLLYVSYPKHGNLTNSMQLHYVKDLAQVLNKYRRAIVNSDQEKETLETFYS